MGCDNMTVVLVCFMHGESYGDLVYRCSRDSSQISRTRRLSSLGNTTSANCHKLGRRMSEPPSLPTRTPVIPSNLTRLSDKIVLSNGGSIPAVDECNGEEEEGEREGEREGEEDGVICEPFETTM